MKSAVTLLAICFASQMSVAGTQKPLTVLPSGESILACGTVSDSFAAVVLKNSGDLKLQSYPMFIAEDGKIYALTGSQTITSKGVKGARMDYEGTNTLPNNGENWCFPAPAGAFYSARGNYIGFFISATESAGVSGQLADIEWGSNPVTLKCTTNFDEMKSWVDAVFKFSPF